MPTLAEQETAIIISVWKEIDWCESYAECFALIEKGKQRIKALTTQNQENAIQSEA